MCVCVCVQSATPAKQLKVLFRRGGLVGDRRVAVMPVARSRVISALFVCLYMCVCVRACVRVCVCVCVCVWGFVNNKLVKMYDSLCCCGVGGQRIGKGSFAEVYKVSCRPLTRVVLTGGGGDRRAGHVARLRDRR